MQAGDTSPYWQCFYSRHIAKSFSYRVVGCLFHASVVTLLRWCILVCGLRRVATLDLALRRPMWRRGPCRVQLDDRELPPPFFRPLGAPNNEAERYRGRKRGLSGECKIRS